jgi:hypothetical protein
MALRPTSAEDQGICQRSESKLSQLPRKHSLSAARGEWLMECESAFEI